ncbi:MAG: RNA methyltransferase [bacterium]|nr:RNA methyltransferase [bacterium]
MLTKNQEKLIASLQTQKGRELEGLCLVEGKKVIETAGKAVLFTFTSKDTKQFKKLVTTETPQDLAGVATIPTWTIKDITKSSTIVVLDGIQDPGNVGSILRLCLGFDASLVLIESADITSPKVVRASAGTMFSVPWIECARKGADELIHKINRPVYRLEARKGATVVSNESIKKLENKVIIIAGSEGSGITLPVAGTSLRIPHDADLESLNVGHSLAILLAMRYISRS